MACNRAPHSSKEPLQQQRQDGAGLWRVVVLLHVRSLGPGAIDAPELVRYFRTHGIHGVTGWVVVI